MPKRLTAIKKKKRLEQLREAQRRRRTRLKESSQKFVQIILPENVLEKVRRLAGETEQTIQALISQIVERSVSHLDEDPEKANGVEHTPAQNTVVDEDEKSDLEGDTGEADIAETGSEDETEGRIKDFVDAAEVAAASETATNFFEGSEPMIVESMREAILNGHEEDEIQEEAETDAVDPDGDPLARTAQLNLF